MNEKSIFAVRHWSFSEILLVAAGFFAIGSVAFFLAVYIQIHSGTAAVNNRQLNELTIEKKAQIVHQLNGNTASTTQNLETSSKPAPHLQADEKDPRAAAKLRILESLNSH